MRFLPPTLVAALLATAAAAAAPLTSKEKSSQTYALAPNGTIQLSDVNGSVDISAWDKAEVLVEIEKRAPSDEDLQGIHTDISATPDSLVIKTKHDKRAGWFGKSVQGEVHYVLKVPAGARLDPIEAVNANIKVQGVRGPAHLRTVNGGIRATGLASDAGLNTVNGSITAEFEVLATGQTVKAETVNGSCELALPKDASTRIDISSVNGNTRCAFPITLEKSGRHTLRGTIDGGGASLKVETVNGGITIKSN